MLPLGFNQIRTEIRKIRTDKSSRKMNVSKVNTAITLDFLTKKPENQYFERKSKETKPRKIAEEVIGMLNADGGVLAFGVTDAGEIEDLNTLNEETLNYYRTLTYDFICPSTNVELEELLINGKLIFLYHIEQDVERVFSFKENENIFLRKTDKNIKLNRDQVQQLEYDKNIRKFEEESVVDFNLEDLDLPLLRSYKESINYDGSELELLYKKHLARKVGGVYVLNNSAVLLFALDPEKYIPNASVRYIRYQGSDALSGVSYNVVKDEHFEHNIPTLIVMLKNFLKASFKDYYFLDIDSGLFIKVPEYPEEAWLEAVVNALCHRSYNVQGNSIYIRHFDDRLEISNSGPLPAQVTVENIKTERFARNPRIARVLEDMGYVRQLNEGVPRIYQSMEASMLSKPEYKVINGNVYLTLTNKIKNHSQTIKESVMSKIEESWKDYNTTQQSILQYLFVENQATVDEIADSLNLSKTTVRDYLKLFILNDIIERKSDKLRDKNALYIFRN